MKTSNSPGRPVFDFWPAPSFSPEHKARPPSQTQMARSNDNNAPSRAVAPHGDFV